MYSNFRTICRIKLGVAANNCTPIQFSNKTCAAGTTLPFVRQCKASLQYSRGKREQLTNRWGSKLPITMRQAHWKRSEAKHLCMCSASQAVYTTTSYTTYATLHVLSYWVILRICVKPNTTQRNFRSTTLRQTHKTIINKTLRSNHTRIFISPQSQLARRS